MNIRLRLTLWYSVILFLILLIFSLAVYVGLTRSLLVTVDNHLQREVGEILGNMTFASSADEREAEEGDGGSDEAEKVRSDLGLQLTYTPEEGVFWRILTADGQPLIDQGHFDGATFDQTVLQSGRTQFEYASLASNVPIRLYTAPFIIERQGSGIIQVAELDRDENVGERP